MIERENKQQEPIQQGMEYTACCTLADANHERPNEAQKIKNAKGGHFSKMDIGKLKAIFDREFQYVSKINPILIGYLFIKEVGWHWWYLLSIPIFLIWIYVDLKYIMPKEFDYIHKKSPVLKKLLNNVK